MVFNFFKKKQKEKPKPLVEKQEQVKEEKKETPAPQKKAKSASLPHVLLHPHITEKASVLGEKGQYVFSVHLCATKNAVKQSVQSLYGVDVLNVRLAKKPAKKIRVGRKEGIKPGLKKAMVTLKAGQTIEVISR